MARPCLVAKVRHDTRTDGASAPRALDQLLRAGQVRGVHHLPLEAERVGPARRVLGEGGHQLARLGQGLLRRREHLVDDRDLARVDRDLAGESHGHAVLALAAQPLEVGDVGIDGVERVDAGRGGGDRAHRARVARDVEVLPALVAHARQAHGRPEVLDAPRDRHDTRARHGDLADVQQALGRLGRDEHQPRAAVRDPVSVLEAVEDLRDLPHVPRVAGLRHHVTRRAARDRLREIVAAQSGGDGVHAHPALAAAEVAPQPLAHDRPRGRLAVGRDRILEVEDEAVGGQRERLLEHPRLAAGNEVERAPRHQARLSIISPLASPGAPAQLALPSHFTARLAGGTGSARIAEPFHRSPRRRHRLSSHRRAISPLASPEAPAQLASPSHFTARLAGGTGSARTAALAHHRVASGAHHELAVLVLRAVLEGDDAPLRPRLRLALVHDLRLRVDRVAVKDRLGELHLVEPEVADGGAQRGLADREPDGDAQGEQAVHERLAELRLGRGVEVEMQRLRVHRHAGEEDVVGLGDGATGLMRQHGADLELLEKLPRHASLLRGGRMVTFQAAMSDATPPPAQPSTATCARCEKTLTEGDRVLAADRAFCRSCYEVLKFELQQAAARMSQDINYPLAALGAVLGGAAGALAWWGFTVLTEIGFGLVAVVIGFLAGHGAVRFAGGKRSAALQAIAVTAGALSFLVAAYLVNMTFINQALQQRGESWRIPFPPHSVDMLYRVLAVNFGLMKLVFLGIVVYEAWVIPRPPKLDLAA